MVTYQLILETGKLEHHQSSHDSRNIQFRIFEVTQRNNDVLEIFVGDANVDVTNSD